MNLIAPLNGAPLLFALLVVLFAGFVRGFSGFGFSAVCVAGLSLLVSPASVIPAIFLLEVLASIGLLKSAWKDIHWSWLGWLVLGNTLCIPLGIALLAYLPETPLRLLVGALLLIAALALRSGFSIGMNPSAPARLLTGMISGLVNGLAAIGGIAVAVLLSTTTMAPAAMRATLIAMFLFTDLYALACAGVISVAGKDATHLLSTDTLLWAAWLTPPMLLGVWFGQKGFVRTSPAAFRQRVLEMLIVVSTLTVVRAAWSLL